jgi:uncharacterized coiled-coil DUF342 family protein
MIKLYADPVERANAIANGVESHADELRKKNYDVTVAGKLKATAAKLQTEAEKYDEMFAEVNKQRDICHDLLSELKETINQAKSGIKSNYDPETWTKFGLTDKR